MIINFFSAIVGGLFVLAGTYFAYTLKTYEENQLTKNSLAAINKEAKMLLDVTKDIFTGAENSENKTFEYFAHINQNYFSKYILFSIFFSRNLLLATNASANLLGAADLERRRFIKKTQ